MILAIEADGAGYRDSGGVRDRDRLRKEHLERLGWRVHRLWSTAWFTDPEGELAKLRTAFDSAVRAAPPPRPSGPAPGTVDGAELPTRALAGRRAGVSRQRAGCGTPPPRRRPRLVASGRRTTRRGRLAATADPARAVRAIPLGSGERQQLSGPAPRALPAAGGATGPIALPAARDAKDR